MTSMQMKEQSRYSAASLWCNFHEAQKDAFDLLFPGQPWTDWQVRRYIDEVTARVPRLQPRQAAWITQRLEKAIRLRELFYEVFSYRSQTSRERHAFFIEVLQQVVGIVKPTIRSRDHVTDLKDGTATDDPPVSRFDAEDSHCRNENCSPAKQPSKEPSTTFDQLAFSTFLESLREAIGQLCELWSACMDEKCETLSVVAGEVSQATFLDLISNSLCSRSSLLPGTRAHATPSQSTKPGMVHCCAEADFGKFQLLFAVQSC